MGDPTLDDPWTPHWNDDLHPSDQERLSTLFADVHPDDQIPHDHPINISGLGLPEHVVQAAMAAPTPLTDDQQFLADSAQAGAPLSGMQGFELEDPTAAQPGAVDPTDSPVLHPEGSEPSPGPITSPEGNAPIEGPITRPSQLPGEPAAPAPLDPFANDPLSNPDQKAGQQQLAKMAATNPQGFIAYQNDWMQKRQRQAASDSLRIEEANRRRAEQDLKDRTDAEAATAQKMAALGQQAEQLGNRALDNDRWWNSRSTGQKVWSFIGAIAGGLRAGMKGADGQNHFLAGIQHEIDQDIDSQKADIMNAREGLNFRRGILNEEFARTGNLYQAAEATRLASYGSVLKELQAQQMLYDPAGTTAFSYAQQIADWQSRIQAHTEKLGADNFKRELESREQQRKEADTLETMRHNRATEANAAAKKGGVGAGTAKADALENPLVAGLAPKDRERVVFSPDGSKIALAVDHEDATTSRDEIATAKAAVGATDTAIAGLLNSPGLVAKLKAKAGLNPQDLAIIKTQLEAVKPQLAKLFSGTKKIPLAELHAIDMSIDNPSNFTAETLAQVQALRDMAVDEVVQKFTPAFPSGFITKDSFGSQPRLAEEPNAATVAAPLLSKPVKGAKGFQAPDANNALGALDQLFRQHVEIPTMAGSNTPGGPEQAQQDYQAELDKIEAAQHANVGIVTTEIAALSAKPKRTPAEAERLAAAKKSLKTYDLILEEIPRYRAKSVAQAQQAAAQKSEAEQRTKDEQERRAHPR